MDQECFLLYSEMMICAVWLKRTMVKGYKNWEEIEAGGSTDGIIQKRE